MTIIVLPEVTAHDLPAFQRLMPGFNYAEQRRRWETELPEAVPGATFRWVPVDPEGFKAFADGWKMDAAKLADYALHLSHQEA